MSELYSSYLLYKGRIRTKIAKKIGREKYSEILPRYAGKRLLGCDEANEFIYDRIISGKPFMACRFGSTELNAVGTFHFK